MGKIDLGGEEGPGQGPGRGARESVRAFLGFRPSLVIFTCNRRQGAAGQREEAGWTRNHAALNYTRHLVMRQVLHFVTVVSHG